MNKILIVILINFIFAISYAEKNEIIIGTTGTGPPFSLKERGVLKGFDIDVTTEIAKRLGKKAVYKDMDFNLILPSITSKKLDLGASGISITDERKKTFDFSIPYYYETLGVNYRSKDNYSTLESLSNKTVCVQLGSTGEIWARANIKTTNFIVMDNQLLCLEAVKSLNADAGIGDGLSTIEFAKKNKDIKSAIISREAEPTGYIFKKGSPLVEQFNKEIKLMEQDGTLSELKSKWGMP